MVVAHHPRGGASDGRIIALPFYNAFKEPDAEYAASALLQTLDELSK